jgi:hypothetical protein
MPVHTTTKAGQPAKQWGEHGHKYTYTANNPESRQRATEKAEAQGKAARAHGYADAKPDTFREG